MIIKKKKYPKIKPLYIVDQDDKKVAVYLKYKVYQSIFEEIADLKKTLSELKQKGRK